MIEIDALTVRQGSFELRDVAFRVPTGDYAVLMGRTGSGKTTILEIICGLRRAAAGRVRLMNRDVTDWRPADRGIGFVPQDGALFTTMNVRDHLGFSLRIRKRPRREIRERAEEVAEMLGITHLLDRGPQGLSGGERQRVSLGRALAFRPDILCLDEPLSALDEDTRHSLCELLRNVARQTGVTTIHITHSRTEALALADRLLVLEHGVVSAQRVERAELAKPVESTGLERPSSDRGEPGLDGA